MLNLPQPDHTPLEHPSLPLVVAQARFVATAQAVSQEVLAEFQARLRESGLDVPRVSALHSGNVVLGPGAPAASMTVQGFQLAAEDGSWLVTLMPDSVALETPAFRSFAEQFGPLLVDVLAAATAAVRPVTLTRAGLRFVNLVHPPVADAEWARWVRSSLVSAHSDELLAPGLVSVSGQLLLQVAPGVLTTVRTGPAEVDGEPAFVLDLDTYTEPSSLWSPEQAAAVFERLNGCGVALFQSLVTPEMLAHLRAAPQPVDVTGGVSARIGSANAGGSTDDD